MEITDLEAANKEEKEKVKEEKVEEEEEEEEVFTESRAEVLEPECLRQEEKKFTA